MARYNIYNLLNPGNDLSLKELFATLGIRANPKLLFEKNIRKEDLLANVLSSLTVQTKEGELRQVLQAPARSGTFDVTERAGTFDIVDIKTQNQDEYFKRVKIYFVIKALLIRSLTIDALKVYIKNEEMKNMVSELENYISRVSAANHARLMDESVLEKQMLDERMRFIIAVTEYEKLRDQAYIQLSEYKQQIDVINIEITELKVEKNKLLAKNSEDLYLRLQNFRLENGDNPTKGIAPEKLHAFAVDLELEDYRLEKQIRTKQAQQKNLSNQLADITERQKQKAGKTAIAHSPGTITNIFGMQRAIASDPLEKDKINIQKEIEANNAQLMSLGEQQKALPAALADKHGMPQIAEILKGGSSKDQSNLLKIINHERPERREKLQENKQQRIIKNEQKIEIVKSAVKVHETVLEAREGIKLGKEVTKTESKVAQTESKTAESAFKTAESELKTADQVKKSIEKSFDKHSEYLRDNIEKIDSVDSNDQTFDDLFAMISAEMELETPSLKNK